MLLRGNKTAAHSAVYTGGGIVERTGNPKKRKHKIVLDKEENFILFFISEKQNCCFIHYNHGYAQSRVVSAQFQSKFR